MSSFRQPEDRPKPLPPTPVVLDSPLDRISSSAFPSPPPNYDYARQQPPQQPQPQQHQPSSDGFVELSLNDADYTFDDYRLALNRIGVSPLSSEAGSIRENGRISGVSAMSDIISLDGHGSGYGLAPGARIGAGNTESDRASAGIGMAISPGLVGGYAARESAAAASSMLEPDRSSRLSSLSVKRVPVGSRRTHNSQRSVRSMRDSQSQYEKRPSSTNSYHLPDMAPLDPLINITAASPIPTHNVPTTTAADSSNQEIKHLKLPSLTENTSYSNHPLLEERNDHVRRSQHAAFSTTGGSINDGPYRRKHQPLWLSLCVFLIILVSLVLSGLFFIIALTAPRYHNMNPNSVRNSINYIVLTSFVAKVIEITFIAGFIVYLGQLLSRRASAKAAGKGVTLSDMSMRTWLMQPLSIITEWETVKYSGMTLLGLFSLLSALMAILYVPAATALVQPRLRSVDTEQRNFVGSVRTNFADPKFVQAACQPLGAAEGSINKDGEATCLREKNIAEAYTNYQRYLAPWKQIIRDKRGSLDMKDRPKGAAMFDQTTVTAAWMDHATSKVADKVEGRTTNNITMVMPHVGLIEAAAAAKNNIKRATESGGPGTYSIHAAVANPAINVLCTISYRQNLDPLVWDTWPESTATNLEGGPKKYDYYQAADPNSTPADDTNIDRVYGWEKGNRPVFPRFPDTDFTILNYRGNPKMNALYTLTRLPSDMTEKYAICSLRAFQATTCSTRYSFSPSGSNLTAICDESDSMTYYKQYKTVAPLTVSADWPTIAYDAAVALSLNGGLNKAAPTHNSYQLPQLALAEQPLAALDPLQPSLAESLAVLFGHTLLSSSVSAPFWSGTWKKEDQTQQFPVLLDSKQFASGATDAVSRAWLAPLVFVFAVNLHLFIYFIVIVRFRLSHDLSEPRNLFTLALNSTPDAHIKVGLSSIPQGIQYGRLNWTARHDGRSVYIHPYYRNHNHPHRNGSTSSASHGAPQLQNGHRLSARLSGLRDRFGNLQMKTPGRHTGMGDYERTPDVEDAGGGAMGMRQQTDLLQQNYNGNEPAGAWSKKWTG